MEETVVLCFNSNRFIHLDDGSIGVILAEAEPSTDGKLVLAVYCQGEIVVKTTSVIQSATCREYQAYCQTRSYGC